MLVRRNTEPDWDMSFGDGLADYYRDNNECIGQNIKSRLLLILGEWFLDTSDGTPWRRILGVQRVDTGAVEQWLRQRVLGTEGVAEITQFSLNLNTATRKSVIAVTVRTIYSTLVTVTV